MKKEKNEIEKIFEIVKRGKKKFICNFLMTLF